MRRQAMVEYEDASPEVRAIYDEIMEVSGTSDVWNMLKAFGHNEMALRGMWGILRNIVLEGELPALLKQLILFKMAVEYGNEYCATLHGHMVVRLDRTLAWDELLTMSEKDSVSFPASYEVAIEVISQMAMNPKIFEVETFDFEEQLRDEGFSEKEIEELIAVGGFGMMVNLMSDVFSIVPDEFLVPPV